MEGYRIINCEWIRGWVGSSKVEEKNLMQIQVINKMWISQEGAGGLEKVIFVIFVCYFLYIFSGI